MARKRKVRSNTRSFVRNTREAFDATRERIEDAKARAEKKVKDNPLSSVLIAAAVGALVGVGTTLLLNNNRKRPFRDRLRDYF